MIDYFHRNPPGLRLFKGPGGIAVQSCPGIFVNLGLESGFEDCLNRILLKGKAARQRLADNAAFISGEYLLKGTEPIASPSITA